MVAKKASLGGSTVISITENQLDGSQLTLCFAFVVTELSAAPMCMGTRQPTCALVYYYVGPLHTGFNYENNART